jgi:hypothetical protein
MQLVARGKIVQHADPEARLFATQHTSAYVSIRQHTCSTLIQRPGCLCFLGIVREIERQKNIKKNE